MSDTPRTETGTAHPEDDAHVVVEGGDPLHLADRPVLVVDFGAQYAQLIARRVRESGVYCEILPWDVDGDEVRAFGARGIILSGGPESVADSQPPAAPQAASGSGAPA